MGKSKGRELCNNSIFCSPFLQARVEERKVNDISSSRLFFII